MLNKNSTDRFTWSKIFPKQYIQIKPVGSLDLPTEVHNLQGQDIISRRSVPETDININSRFYHEHRDSVHSTMKFKVEDFTFFMLGRQEHYNLLEMLIYEAYIYGTSFDSVFSTARRWVPFYQNAFKLFPDLPLFLLYFSQLNLTCKLTKTAYSFMLFLQPSHAVKPMRERIISKHTRIRENKTSLTKTNTTKDTWDNPEQVESIKSRVTFSDGLKFNTKYTVNWLWIVQGKHWFQISTWDGIHKR